MKIGSITWILQAISSSWNSSRKDRTLIIWGMHHIQCHIPNLNPSQYRHDQVKCHSNPTRRQGHREHLLRSHLLHGRTLLWEVHETQVCILLELHPSHLQRHRALRGVHRSGIPHGHRIVASLLPWGVPWVDDRLRALRPWAWLAAVRTSSKWRAQFRKAS